VGNLPGGEVFTTPGEVNGTFVIDGVVGDYLCAKFGDLKANPLTIQVKANRWWKRILTIANSKTISGNILTLTKIATGSENSPSAPTSNSKT